MVTRCRLNQHTFAGQRMCVVRNVLNRDGLIEVLAQAVQQTDHEGEQPLAFGIIVDLNTPSDVCVDHAKRRRLVSGKVDVMR